MKRKSIVILFMVALISMLPYPPFLYGADVYYEKNKEGWFWHKTKKQIKKKKKIEKKIIQAPASPHQKAVQQVEGIKEKTQELLSMAIVDPTEENLVDFMAHQKKLLDMSDRFRKAWELALLTNADLDYTADHPISTIALQAKNREAYLQQIQQINQIGQEAGIYFIFASTCPYCVEQAKVLKRFENSYGISVFPLTINGEGLSEYPYPDDGRVMANGLNIRKTPTLILAYPGEDKMLPLASGLVTEDELIRRILILNRKKEEI